MLQRWRFVVKYRVDQGRAQGTSGAQKIVLVQGRRQQARKRWPERFGIAEQAGSPLARVQIEQFCQAAIQGPGLGTPGGR